MHVEKKDFILEYARRRTLSSPIFISSSPSAIITYITFQKKRCTVEQRESTTRNVVFLNIIEFIYHIYIPYTITFPGMRLRIWALYSTRNLFVSRTSSTEVGPLLTAVEKSGCLLELDMY